MSYRLRFHELALVEWKKLDGSIREPQKKKLTERLENSGEITMQSAEEIFEAELKERHVAFSRLDADGFYKLHLNTGDMTICLENVVRNYKRDGDPEIIKHFVDKLLLVFIVPPWEEAVSLLFFSAQPADHQFGDTIQWRVTEKVCKVLVLTDIEQGKITWVTPDMLMEWNVSQEEAVQAAAANMDRLLEGKEPELAPGDIDGMRLGMVPVCSVFKASIIFAPNFKHFVSKKLEWPVLLVIPCRDFIFIREHYAFVPNQRLNSKS